MATKFVLFMRLGRSGWSETYYRGSDLGLDVAGQFIAKGLAEKRMALCTNSVSCDAVRISMDTGDRTSILREFTAPLTGVTGVEGSRDVRGVGLLCQLASSDYKYKRPLWLRGLPDDWLTFTVGGKLNIPAAFNAPFRDFAQYLAGEIAPWAILAISKDGAVNPKLPIISISRHATGNALLNVPAATVDTARERVVISKADFGGQGPPGFNGPHLAVGPPALGLTAGTVLLLNTPINATQVAAYAGGGILQTKRRRFFPAGHLDVIRASIHDTGRPTSEGRGRRRKRATTFLSTPAVVQLP